MCVLGVEGSEKKCGPLRIISGTALTSKDLCLFTYEARTCAHGFLEAISRGGGLPPQIGHPPKKSKKRFLKRLTALAFSTPPKQH